MNRSQAIQVRRREWLTLLMVLALLSAGACSSPVGLSDSAAVEGHTGSSGDHSTSSGNLSKSERSRAP